MTGYTVVWVQSSEDELAEVWLGSSDRDAVTAATSAIEAELRADAESKGVELSEGLRSLNAPPLRVIFSVRGDDRIAEVLLVRRI